jgi:acetyl esterase
MEATAVVRWLADAGADLGIDAGSVVLAGDSAGANLALATALALRDWGESPVVRLMLFYGMYAPDFDTEAHRRYGGGDYGLTTERMRWFWEAYLGDDGQAADPFAAPLRADLRGLPPALIIAAGCDCLRDDSLHLADRLHDAAVPHVLSRYDGVPHSFMQLSRAFAPAMTAIVEAAAVLRALGSTGGSHVGFEG